MTKPIRKQRRPPSVVLREAKAITGYSIQRLRQLASTGGIPGAHKDEITGWWRLPESWCRRVAREIEEHGRPRTGPKPKPLPSAAK